MLEIRPETNEVVIGTYEESLTRALKADQLNFMAVLGSDGTAAGYSRRSDIIIREHGALWRRPGEDEITCVFEEPIRAVTPGQAVVLYDGEYVLGGGTIQAGQFQVRTCIKIHLVLEFLFPV